MTLKSRVRDAYTFIKPEHLPTKKVFRIAVRKSLFVLFVWWLCGVLETHGIFHRFGKSAELFLTAIVDHYTFDGEGTNSG